MRHPNSLWHRILSQLSERSRLSLRGRRSAFLRRLVRHS